jgi:hypothetical protein
MAQVVEYLHPPKKRDGSWNLLNIDLAQVFELSATGQIKPITCIFTVYELRIIFTFLNSWKNIA